MILSDNEPLDNLPDVVRFCGHGFDVREADLIAGKRFTRSFWAPDPKAPGGPPVEVVVNLRWDDRLGMPAVTQYRKDLMIRIFGEGEK